jgi:hypothetical protein
VDEAPPAKTWRQKPGMLASDDERTTVRSEFIDPEWCVGCLPCESAVDVVSDAMDPGVPQDQRPDR